MSRWRGEGGRASPLRHLGLEDLGLEFMSEEFVVLWRDEAAARRGGGMAHNVPADALLIYGKGLHGELHPVKAGALPDKVGGKVVGALGRDALGAAEFETDFVRDVWEVLGGAAGCGGIRTVWNLDDMADALPGLVEFAGISQPELVADGESDLAALELGEVEPGDPLLVQAEVPADGDVGLCLALFETLVVVSLDLDEGAEDVLILVCILVPWGG